ncbi:ABC-F family ATP-binding cassette domain-containing protein [Phocaeicola dorei]|uniref:ABC-F family ATP-binding cassette domain-containing protein n=1 Tax=Phocaeicola dorei TaxID=357276 RepID=UPI00111128EE|nr:ABC-F family ATP-binding cassette domain-containing protein [Phocaeicola dorei]
MSLIVQDLSYIHPNKDFLFQNITFTIPAGEKCAIVGNNGVGKSTLLRILAGKIPPATGTIVCDDILYMIPQHFGQFDGMSVAEALGLADKLRALSIILNGHGTEKEYDQLNDDWDIMERLAEAFAKWQVGHITPDMFMGNLSGGEKTKVFLAGQDIYKPSVVLMDEPTNHLDTAGRTLLYEYIVHTNRTTIIVSHDRTLLNLLSVIYEMSPTGIQFYPMNYDAYRETVNAETNAKVARLENRQKELAKAEKSARKTKERQQKHASRGEKQSAKKCVARISMGLLGDRSEATTSRLNKVHQEKMEAMKQEINEIRSSINEYMDIKINIGDSSLVGRKLLVEAKNVTFRYPDRDTMWRQHPLDLTIFSGERIRIQGDNGCGKSTLLKLITGALQPTSGEMYRNEALKILYLDQEYSCIDNELTVFGQLEACNSKKPEHELKMLLNRFLFTSSAWDKKCESLSGGEKMKLALCHLIVCETAPDMIIADEPTNNIDIASMDILAAVLKNYKGTLLVVSHDEQFIHDVDIERTICFPK